MRISKTLNPRTSHNDLLVGKIHQHDHDHRKTHRVHRRPWHNRKPRRSRCPCTSTWDIKYYTIEGFSHGSEKTASKTYSVVGPKLSFANFAKFPRDYFKKGYVQPDFP
ncbi:hypothetical protein BDV28DRAFT_127682 [Aspergillus coremiiformis]|uniref:Uncharacterized protein n=1 Tax=Aspergillus coremiiformis TaxID=138285 RepID=A0A5N6ZEM1_9EURO|nr:hypothetical protein BDV28DRAFT_127682 [Aspergillus coremiiformis]